MLINARNTVQLIVDEYRQNQFVVHQCSCAEPDLEVTQQAAFPNR